MTRFEQVVQLATEVEEGLSAATTVTTLVVLGVALVTIAALLTLATWRHEPS